MTISTISTIGLLNASRTATMQVTRDLNDAQVEVSSGRHADVGLALGTRTGQAVAIRVAQSDLETIRDTNAAVDARLSTMQTVMSTIRVESEAFTSDLIAVRADTSDRSIIVEAAANKMGSLVGALGTSFDGAALFSGLQTDSVALNAYQSTPPSAGQTAVITAFTTHFGFGPNDPNVANITANDLQVFLDGAFAAVFDDPSWTTNFSNATDEVRSDRISQGETITTGISANEGAFRSLVQAYSAVLDLGTEALNAEAYQTLVDHTLTLVGDATAEITVLEGRTGQRQERVADAQEMIGLQIDVLKEQSARLEGVDSYEAATRLNTLVTQLEASYAVTARMQRLSLLNYL